MTKWILLTLLLVLLLFVFLFRFGVEVTFEETGPLVKLRLGPGYLRLWPSAAPPEKAREKRRRKEEKKSRKQAAREAKKAQKPPREKPSVGGLLELALDLLPVVKEAGGRTKERLQIDRLILHLTWGEEDPADAAIHYGRAWGILEGILAVLEGQFTIKEKQLSADVDFVGEKTRLYARAGLSMTLAQMTAIGVPAGVGALQVLLRWRKEQKRSPGGKARSKKEVPHGKESSGK